MPRDTRPLFYSRYIEWKAWGGVGHEPAHLVEEFEIEVRRAGLPPGAAILEIGFGGGEFLDWARAAGYRPTGIDINPGVVAAAQERGHEVHQGDAKEVLESYHETFDAIVCLDVLEHQTLPELVDYFSVLTSRLKQGGKIIARFPNGASPFGRLYQYGDATHMTVLTGALMNQLAMLSGMTVLGEYNAARSARGPGGRGLKDSVVARKLAYMMRDAVSSILSLIYFGRIVPFDPKMTVVIGQVPPDS